MSWEEHEKTYCDIIDSEPLKEEIFEVCGSWADAQNEIYFNDAFEDNHLVLRAVKYRDKYYIVFGDG